MRFKVRLLMCHGSSRIEVAGYLRNWLPRHAAADAAATDGSAGIPAMHFSSAGGPRVMNDGVRGPCLFCERGSFGSSFACVF